MASPSSSCASALTSNDQTAANNVVAACAADHLNAAVYSYSEGDEHLYLRAIFTRCRASPRGEVQAVILGKGTDHDGKLDPAEARARAWPFTQRADLRDLLCADCDSCMPEEVHVLCFYRGGDAFSVPLKVEATEELELADGCNVDYEAAECVQSFFVNAHIPAAFSVATDEGATAHKIAAAIVDKVLHFVGEVNQKKETEGESGDSKKRKTLE